MGVVQLSVTLAHGTLVCEMNSNVRVSKRVGVNAQSIL
jgi:hypothetical protein